MPFSRTPTSSGRRSLIAALGLVLLSVALCGPVHGQTEGDAPYTMTFRGVPLSKALVRIAETTQANLVYDAGMVEGVRVYCSVRDASIQGVLQCVLDEVPIDFFQTSAGTYVLTPSPRKEPQRGHLTGTVVDAQTGEPLPNAHVLLAAANTGVATDPAGRFRLPSVTAGPHRLVATHVGYESAADTVRVSPADSTHHQISLSPQSITTRPVVVTQSRRRRPADGLGTSMLSPDELRDPGALGAADVVGQASTLLGVHAQRPLADLHVQGGATGEHQVRLDGIPVRNPVTLRRMLGAFSPLALDRLTVRKAGYGVEHGSTVSGVLDARHAVSTSSPGVGQIQIDPFSANAELHHSTSLGPSRSAQFRVAARRSIWDAYRDPTLRRLLRDWNLVDPMLLATYFGNEPDLPVVPNAQTSSLGFSDLHATARVDLDAYRSLRVSVYHGTNRLRTEFVGTSPPPGSTDPSVSEDGSAMLTKDQYAWTNHAAQARLDWMLGARTSTSLRIQASQQTVRRGYQMSYTPSGPPSEDSSSGIVDTLRDALDPSLWPDDRNRIQEVSLTGTGSYSISSRHHLKAAVDVSRISSRFHLGNRFFRPMAFQAVHWQVGGYARGVLSLGAGTTVNAGTRLTYIPSRRTVYAEPRLVLRHEGTRAPVGDYALRLGGGLYRQFVNRFDVSSTSPTSILPSLRFWLPTTRAHAPPRAYHATLSARIRPFDQWEVTAEGYLKQYPHLLALDYTAFQGDRETAVSPSRAVAPSRGSAAGLGVAIARHGPAFESTLRYDWSRSRRQFPSRFDGRLVPPPWNQPHRVALSTRANTGLGLEFNARGTYASGRSWGFRRTYYDYLGTRPETENPTSRSFQNPAQHTLAPTVRLDVGGAYSLQLGPATVHAQITVANVLDRRNPFDWGLQPTEDGSTRTMRPLPGRRLRGTLSVRY